jgi:hypothetical protein
MTARGEWEELQLGRLHDVHASRLDALTGQRVTASCKRVALDHDHSYLGVVLTCSLPHNVDHVFQTWSCSAGAFGGKYTAFLARMRMRWIGEGVHYFPDTAQNIDGELAMRRLALDLSAVMFVKFGGTLFRLLRSRAFRRAIRNRVRAKLVLSRAPLFGDLPEALQQTIARQWV